VIKVDVSAKDDKTQQLIKSGISSRSLAVARIAVGIMFLFFAQYKLASPDFAHGGYQKYLESYINETSPEFYKPLLRLTLQHPVFFGYTVGIAELLIAISMLFGVWVRLFSVVGALFMLNITLASWCLPPGTPSWKYLGVQLDHIPLMLMFIVFAAHNAGATWGMDRR
jgi:uncharacterized membrane protein YphA (DoxX/SURF4 family)